MTPHPHSIMNSKFRCDECDKDFARKFTLERHMASKHHDEGEEYESSNEESLEEKDSNVSETGSVVDDTEMKTDEAVWKYYADVAWKDALEETDSFLRDIKDVSGIDEKDKREWLKTMNKRFVDAYRSDLLHYIDLKEDPVHSSVMLTRKKMMREFDMDIAEATKVAINQRKYLILGETPDWLSMLTNMSHE